MGEEDFGVPMYSLGGLSSLGSQGHCEVVELLFLAPSRAPHPETGLSGGSGSLHSDLPLTSTQGSGFGQKAQPGPAWEGGSSPPEGLAAFAPHILPGGPGPPASVLPMLVTQLVSRSLCSQPSKDLNQWISTGSVGVV